MNSSASVRYDLNRLLPNMRRFALMLTGNLPAADDLVRASCERMLRDNPDRGSPDRSSRARVAVFSDIAALLPDPAPHRRGNWNGLPKSPMLGTLLDLPGEMASVLLLVSVEGCSYAETARILGMQPARVMTLMASARVELGDTHATPARRDMAEPLLRRLSGFFDGELGDEAREAVEVLADKDPEIAAQLADFLDTDAIVKDTLAPLIDLPLPQALVSLTQTDTDDDLPRQNARAMAPAPAQAQTAPPRAAERATAPRGRFEPPPPGPEADALASIPPAAPRRGAVALASNLALLVLAGGIGWYLGGKLTPPPPVAAPAPVREAERDWLRDAVDHHRIFGSDTGQMVAGAADADALLAARAGVPVAVPDLSGDGLTFQGARLLAAAGRPVAQLVYLDAGGVVHSLFAMRDSAGATAGFAARDFPGVGTVAWRSATAAYAVAGPTGSGPVLQALAQSVAPRL